MPLPGVKNPFRSQLARGTRAARTRAPQSSVSHADSWAAFGLTRLLAAGGGAARDAACVTDAALPGRVSAARL